jgi:ribosomal protein L29
MKRNDIKQLASKKDAELHKQLAAIHLELGKAKLAQSAGKLANVRLISNLRDDVARIKTVLHIHQMTPVAQPVAEVAKK